MAEARAIDSELEDTWLVSGAALDAVVAETIERVDAGRWDTLAGDNALASHGWLRTVERCFPGIELRYVLLCAGDQIVAGAVCERLDPERPGFSPDRLMFRRFSSTARRLGASWHPALSCVPFRAYGDQLMVHPQLRGEERQRVFGQLLEAVEELAFSDGRSLWFPRVAAEDVEIDPLLRSRGYYDTPLPPLAVMDIEWKSFDGYLAAVRNVSKNARKTVKNQIRRFERSGAVIEPIEEPERHRDRLHELADGHYLRLNQVGVPFSPDFLPELKSNLGSDAVIYGAFRDSELTGFSLMLRRNGIGHLPTTGIDPETTRDNFAYFNLCYYRPIADAIEWRMRRLTGGTTLYGMKSRRGYQIQSLRAFFRSASPARHRALGPAFALHAAFVDRRTRERGREDVEVLRRFLAE